MDSTTGSSWMHRLWVVYLSTALVLLFARGVHAIATVRPHQTLGPFPIAGQQVVPPPGLPYNVSNDSSTITVYPSEPLPDLSKDSVFFRSMHNSRTEAVQLTGIHMNDSAPLDVSTDQRQVDIWDGLGDPRPLAEALQPGLADPTNWVVITNQQRQQLLADLWYLNVRSSGEVDANPQTGYPAWLEDELRGQLVASIYAIPAPSALMLGGIGVALARGLRRWAYLA